MHQNYSGEIKRTLKKKGFISIFRGVKLYSEYFIHVLSNPFRSFKCGGKKFRYFYHPYNATWRNERCIEIPLIKDILRKSREKEILEFGNVTSHYLEINHEVLDKYEKAEGVLNEDIIHFNNSKKYDLIICISTLEHVGFDETPKEPYKVLEAIEKLRKCLKTNGKIYITLPIGQNIPLDNFISSKKIKFDKEYLLKRISKNKWAEVDYKTANKCKYNFPFPSANAIRFGIINK